jgi:formate-dependent nitrite reductase cytochrome c552 subunit
MGGIGPEINNNIGCADCHDSENMNLMITRPALVEAFQRREGYQKCYSPADAFTCLRTMSC